MTRLGRTKTFSTLLLVVSGGGLVLGSAYGVWAHESCSVTFLGWPNVFHGDEHDNTLCNGTSSFDSIYAEGGGDDVRGYEDKDKLRGATGWDLLDDRVGNADDDTVCDGGGQDNVKVEDGDGKDHWHQIDDGTADFYDGDDGQDSSPDTHNSCPMSDP
ncbi:MAG: hypothetical protein ABR613_13330 [Actinomycetota bacterium]